MKLWALENLVEDIAAASASYLCNLLPAIMRLSHSEVYERLEDHIRTAILVFIDLSESYGIPEPSEN